MRKSIRKCLAASALLFWCLGFMLSCNVLGITTTVSYNANIATAGSVPAEATEYSQGDIVTVLDNTGGLAKSGRHFTGWNTKSDGSGAAYAAGQTFVMGASSVVLYAQLTLQPPSWIIGTWVNGVEKDASSPSAWIYDKWTFSANSVIWYDSYGGGGYGTGSRFTQDFNTLDGADLSTATTYSVSAVGFNHQFTKNDGITIFWDFSGAGPTALTKQ